jgi:hypothetical protein
MPTFLPSHLLTFLLFTFLLSYFSKYLCLSVFIVVSPYPISSFLIPNFWYINAVILALPDSAIKIRSFS